VDERDVSPQGPHWGTWGGGSTYCKLLKLAGGHWLWRICHYGSSVRETCRWGSLAGNPEGYERKAMGMATPYMGAQATWSGLLYQGFREMAERGSRGGASLSLSLYLKGAWKAPLLGTLVDS
jgi:hypothetical protein